MSDPRDPSGHSAGDLISMGFIATPTLSAKIENTRKVDASEVSGFDALLVAGGQAPMFTFAGAHGLPHMIELYRLLGGGQRDAGRRREHMSKNRLAILPNVTHHEMFMAPQLAPTVRPFLDGKTDAPRWSEQVAKPGDAR